MVLQSTQGRNPLVISRWQTRMLATLCRWHWRVCITIVAGASAVVVVSAVYDHFVAIEETPTQLCVPVKNIRSFSDLGQAHSRVTSIFSFFRVWCRKGTSVSRAWHAIIVQQLPRPLRLLCVRPSPIYRAHGLCELMLLYKCMPSPDAHLFASLVSKN